MKDFFSPGKLLITSEYFVLDGAKALAVPTKMGQSMSVNEMEDGKKRILWSAFHGDRLWLEAEFNQADWQVILTDNHDTAEFLAKVFLTIEKFAPSKFDTKNSFHFTTTLDFPNNFGLGSSSTFINNLASWAEIDAFHLNQEIFGGSGYDIAVAQQSKSILYQLIPAPTIEIIDFEPPFLDQIIFVHLNSKQNSREGIAHYRMKEKSPDLIDEFSEVTERIISSKNLQNFRDLIDLHEEKVSNFIELPTVKSKLFPNYQGSIKSLGAWGGDFVLATKTEGYLEYFRDLGYTTIFDYNKLILKL